VIRARANINLPGMGAGDEYPVDETDPWVRSLLEGGFLDPVVPSAEWCYWCVPPSRHATPQLLAEHGLSVHGEVAGDGDPEREYDPGSR